MQLNAQNKSKEVVCVKKPNNVFRKIEREGHFLVTNLETWQLNTTIGKNTRKTKHNVPCCPKHGSET